MENVHRLTQAYSQAPWRKQLQWIGLFLLGLILVSLIAGIYLNVTARAATIGRSIQEMRREIDALKLSNADLETNLASITSSAEMEKRARELGFAPIDPDERLYIVVPGYTTRRPAVVASPPAPALRGAPSILPDYTQSLFDWLRERVFEPAAPLVEVEP